MITRWIVAVPIAAISAVSLVAVSVFAARGTTSTGVLAVSPSAPTAIDPGCTSDAGQLFYCALYNKPDGAGQISAAVLNPLEWPATNSPFTNGCAEGCIISDASFAPGDGFLHQIVRPNTAPDAECFAYWPPIAGAFFVPPTDAAGPWSPPSCNPNYTGSTQSTSLISNPDGGAYVITTTINNPNVVGLDNDLIFYTRATFCPNLYHQACLWQIGFYRGVNIGEFWEIDGSLGILNLWDNDILIAGKTYGGNIPLSCNPNVAGCDLAFVIDPGVSIQVWVNGVSMGVNGNITSSHVPHGYAGAVYIQKGIEVAPPGPGAGDGVPLLTGPDKACAYIGVPNCGKIGP